jgi:hypothetical protein
MRAALRLLLALVFVSACASDRREGRERTSAVPPVETKAGASAKGSAGLLHDAVRPSDTDPAIGSPDDDHHVYLSAGGPGNGKLLVFLPGTGGRPANATLFLQEAARAGYHAIGLDYPNLRSAGQVCGDDLDCYDRMRHESFDGTSAGAGVGVSPENSIKHRLVALLSWLSRRHPDQGWGAFLVGRDLQYGSLALAGHSQGGGHAAYIAKLHRVARVLMFGSICDTDRAEPPTAATWVSGPHATPIDRYYGLSHTADPFAEKIASTWRALGLDQLGPRTPVDGAAAPYGGSHQLITSIPQPSGRRAHGSVVADRATPIRQGVPQYRDVWRYMLGT